jgi:hypothetical protein
MLPGVVADATPVAPARATMSTALSTTVNFNE